MTMERYVDAVKERTLLSMGEKEREMIGEKETCAKIVKTQERKITEGKREREREKRSHKRENNGRRETERDKT